MPNMIDVYDGYSDGLKRGKAILDVAFAAGTLVTVDDWRAAFYRARECMLEESEKAGSVREQIRNAGKV